MSIQRVALSDHFTYKKIFFQTINPIMMMIFISIYGAVDGLFVSNFDSIEGFAAVNLIMPLIMIIGGFGYMFGSGGSALVGKLLGEKKNEYANRVFTMVVLMTIICGVSLSTAGFFLVEPIAKWLGNINSTTNPLVVEKAIIYGRILVCGQFLYMLQSIFQNFFVVNERQGLGFIFTLSAGLTNMVFDALFIAVFGWGVVGAAVATILGMVVAGIGPLIYFIVNKKGLIHLTKTKLEAKPIIKSCTNGFSDFIFNISSSIVGFIYNVILLKYFGDNGVTAYGVAMYVTFIFIAIFIGYVVGMGPVISYHYGAKNTDELKNIKRKSFLLIGIVGLVMGILCLSLARPLSLLFCRESTEAVELSIRALRIYSPLYLLAGYCIFITNFFTSLNNGLVSGLISLFRTLIAEVVCVFVLPLIFGGESIWWATILANSLSIIVCVCFLLANKKKYQY
ncbi:MAG: MATE family efflux transporter [Gammaproteobacteria bacterium]|nr:MATE family efflux transporter [Gammaproteobacteria bacterium]